MNLKSSVNFSLAVVTAFLFTTGCSQVTSQPAEQQQQVDFSEVIPTLQATAAEWNRGDMQQFVSIYDSSATFMTTNGLIGASEMKEYYTKHFSTDGTSFPHLMYDDLQMRPLGEKHALVTGRFILTNPDSTQQTGRYSVVFGHTDNGWKMLHDHSN